MNQNIRVRIDDDDDTGGAAPAVMHKENDDSRRAAAAERARTRAEQRNAQEQTLRNQRQTVTYGIQEADAKGELTQRLLAEALEQGNYEESGRLQREMSKIEARRLLLEEAEANLTAATVQHQRQSADPVEAFIQSKTERSAEWLRNHREFVEDPKKNAKLTAAHHNAVGEGLEPDSDSYFKHVESFIGLRNGDAGETRQHRSADGVTIAKLKPGDPLPKGAVRMTRGEYEAATETITWNHNDPQGRFKKGEPIGVREYLRRKNAQRAEGRFNQLEGY